METTLHHIEPARQCFRFYRLAVWPDLFGGFSLVREWGRLGQPGKLWLDSYDSQDEAETALVHLARAKRRKGYREAA